MGRLNWHFGFVESSCAQPICWAGIPQGILPEYSPNGYIPLLLLRSRFLIRKLVSE